MGPETAVGALGDRSHRAAMRVTGPGAKITQVPLRLDDASRAGGYAPTCARGVRNEEDSPTSQLMRVIDWRVRR